MANPKYTVMTFKRRGPEGMGPPAQGDWFYYEIGTNNNVTLTGYRSGIQADVEHVVAAIIDRLNRDIPGASESAASRLIFPAATAVAEDEDGNIAEDDESPTAPEVDE